MKTYIKLLKGLFPPHQDFDARLGSFSLSYSRNISTEHLHQVLEALSDSISEIGLVDSNPNDEHGGHVIDFIARQQLSQAVPSHDFQARHPGVEIRNGSVRYE